MLTDNLVNYITDKMVEKYELEGFKKIAVVNNETIFSIKLRTESSLMTMELKFKQNEIPKVLFLECLNDYRREQVSLSEFLAQYNDIKDFGGDDVETDIELCIKRAMNGKLQFVDAETGEVLK